MRDVDQHFELFGKAIEYSSAVQAEVESERLDATNGRIRGVIYFADGSRLEFSEQVFLEKSRLVKSKYRYQLVRDGEAIFRYDNAPHHEHIATHPHHKHIGAEILPAIEPEFSKVLAEAEALVSAETGGAGQAGKKRRQRKSKKI